MPPCEPSGKSSRQAVGLPEPRLLVRVAFHRRVSFHRRANRAVADGKPGYLCGRRQIAIEQRRLHRQRVGVGIEAAGLRIGRQHGRRIDLDTEQIANRIRVFSSIEAMKAGGASGIGMRRGSEVERGFEPAGGGVVGRVVRPPSARRRHGAAPQLHDNFFPRVCGALDVIRINAFQREISCPRAIVVTRDAVFRHHIARGVGRFGPRDSDGGDGEPAGEPSDDVARHHRHDQLTGICSALRRGVHAWDSLRA